jgi:hypothetical protein
MKEADNTECLTLADDVTLYAWGGLTDDLRPAVEAHLRECPSCAKFVAFMKDFIAANRERLADAEMPSESHPDASLIVELEADELDIKTSREVSLHLLDCRPCREAYLRLRSLSNERFEERLLAEEIDLAESHSANTLVGPVRIVRELHLEVSEPMRVKVLKAKTGEGFDIGITVYECRVSAARSLFTVDCVIGPLPNPPKGLLNISAFLATDEEFEVSAHDCADLIFYVFRIPPYRYRPGTQLLLNLNFSSGEQHLRFRLPAREDGVDSTIRPAILDDETDREIIQMFALGFSCNAIGKDLSLSPAVVKNRIRDIFVKLDPPTGAEVPWYAIDFDVLLRSE